MADEYKWIKFYEEFADVLKEHENNPELLNILNNIIKEVNEDSSKNYKLKELNIEVIDPFGVYGLFNQDISKEKRLNILKKIKDKFSILSELPDHFAGIPPQNSIAFHSYLNNITEDSAEKVWNLFKLALDYSKGNNKSSFISAYNDVLKIKGISWNLSVFLYMIRPRVFINLDSTNRNFLKNKRYIDKKVVSKIESFKYKSPSGDIYLEICEDCKEKLLNNDVYIFNTFPELSHIAWSSSYPKKRFNDYLDSQNLVFDKELIENYLLSLKVKPFVIFTGNSGTGKTKLAKEFANYCISEKLILPVGSNWTDNRNIFGYYNPILKNYSKTSSLELIESANESSQPHFLILDEMNLSHVERYFADYLSAIESGNSIPLTNYESGEISLPDNLFIVGTVNVDETTYMFSPKVLDRANTIEFKTMLPEDYLENKSNSKLEGNLHFLLDPLSGIDVRNKDPKEFKNEFEVIIVKEKYSENNNLWDVLEKNINILYKILSKSKFDFGFRVINEIYRFMYVAWVYENEPNEFTNWNRYFDAQILQKLLPRIHGSGTTLLDTLEELEDYCEKNNFIKSKEKITEMKTVLKNQKFVSFIN